LYMTELTYNTEFIVWVNATDYNDSIAEIFNFSTRGEFFANPPGNFTASSYNTTQINLTWTNGANSDKTYIRYIEGGSSPINRSYGTFLYNDTGESVNLDGLTQNTQYSFIAWGWNNTDANFSSSNITTDATTQPTSAPAFTSPNPSNNSGSGDVDQATVEITINDLDGDTFNWTIQGTHVTNTGADGASNGTKSANLITLLPYSTSIVWFVNATDTEYWTNSSYVFVTRAAYQPGVPTGFSSTVHNRT
ncbi:unnamed protein product, partial [marine sediment metagenome]